VIGSFFEPMSTGMDARVGMQHPARFLIVMFG
jgi:hypothetical protein